MTSSHERVLSLLRERTSDELVERLVHLDARRGERAPEVRPRAPDRGARPDVDVLLAGGGLSLLLAPMLAADGLRVAVCDRGRIGVAHREWNGSTREIDGLVASGLGSREAIEELVVARYDRGLCRWHRGGSYDVRGVLDHAIDAGGLLAMARARAEQRGVELLDGEEVLGQVDGGDLIAASLRSATGARRTLTARVLVDGRGASSPYATADLVCPTVGGVIDGLEQAEGDAARVDPKVGEILATTDDVEDGRQHLWETFPGAGGATTVYLFYYARSTELRRGALLELYARFFERLGAYKRGDARLVRPTFGLIPGWSRLGGAPKSPSPRVVLVGDAAARHSPLTFCGFGSSVRSLAANATKIAALARGTTAAPTRDEPIHAGTGALSLMLASPPRDASRAGMLNDLLDAAFASLHASGDELYGALLRDEMSVRDFVHFLRATAAKRPGVYRDVTRALSASELVRWSVRLAREVALAS